MLRCLPPSCLPIVPSCHPPALSHRPAKLQLSRSCLHRWQGAAHFWRPAATSCPLPPTRCPQRRPATCCWLTDVQRPGDAEGAVAANLFEWEALEGKPAERRRPVGGLLVVVAAIASSRQRARWRRLCRDAATLEADGLGVASAARRAAGDGSHGDQHSQQARAAGGGARKTRTAAAEPRPPRNKMVAPGAAAEPRLNQRSGLPVSQLPGGPQNLLP